MDQVFISSTSNVPRETINPSFLTLFFDHVSRSPEQWAVITEDGNISYAELANRAQLLAVELCEKGLLSEEPVGVLLESGIEHVVCQVAIILAGGSCVPLNVNSPDGRLNFMLEAAQARFTITNNSYLDRVLDTQFIVLNDVQIHTVENADFPGMRAGDTHRGYIMFTSGTTGTPKAVQVELRGIRRLVINACYLPISTDYRLGSISGPDFDAILFEVWGALLNGATVVIIKKETLLSPEKLKLAFVRHSVGSILVTPSLFSFIIGVCPGAFRTLSHLMIGGEAFNLQALRSLPLTEWPLNIYNIYGPTENTVYSLYYPIEEKDLEADNIPLGKPIDKTDVFVLDECLQPVAIDALGELYVGGEGVARGYLNRQDLTAEKFITTQFSGESKMRRLYKTGDLGRKRADGNFMYAGRVDNQIKLQGYRIEPEEIEVQLLNTELLQEAIVCSVKQVGDEGYLIAFVVPVIGVEFCARTLLGLLSHVVPAYMLPRIEVVSEILLNKNGKADRAALMERYRHKRLLKV